jgi:hypothetical protein
LTVAAVNKLLAKKKLETVEPLTRKAWDASNTGSEYGVPATGKVFRERD